ncbi:hypothetical protein [Actinokineospora iranica]|uniref:Uncharacterized protein n=1 Tax=Actinokineospora iranica TaxID=1271860 RepID=A0A1G6JW11_9PSEU|nr:hypothetical protein [Actinokineospora iranica]SDC22811.1 hypothetical protein SAMN05216174_101584 [Actinokineospora iranica]
MSDDIGLPMYWEYHGTAFKLEAGPEGEWVGSLLNPETGLFDRDDRPTLDCLFATTTSYITTKPFEEFVWTSERVRSYHLTGDGPIFALYDTIKAIRGQAEAENRRLTGEELAMVKSIYRRTFTMWEEEQKRREAGEPPSFEVRQLRPF